MHFLAVAAEDSQTSDNDGSGERPVRNKLKETTITSAPTNPVSEDPSNGSGHQAPGSEDSRASSRGRKRSFNEDQPDMEDDPEHRRKRSRDSNPEDEDDAQVEMADEGAEKKLGPKKKRSRDQLDKDEPAAEDVAKKSNDKSSEENGAAQDKPEAEGEPEKKRHRDEEKGSVSLGFFELWGRSTC